MRTSWLHRLYQKWKQHRSDNAPIGDPNVDGYRRNGYMVVDPDRLSKDFRDMKDED